jgi:acetylornithine deacetylase/succinyl-diaminopimelate desuccinylase-like protein
VKPIFIAALLALAALPTATWADEPNALPDRQDNKVVALDENLPASHSNNDARSKEPAIVLAEVRKVLESNPANTVVELSIDPDYTYDKDGYLVNAVVAAQERRFSLGVIVTLQPGATGRKTLMAFVD